MADKTGRALGTLDPVIYFEKINGGIWNSGVWIEKHLLLPPIEIGTGIGLARAIWEKRYKEQGYEWREAGTLSEVQRLQRRLVEQEQQILNHQGQTDENRRRRVHAETSANLRQRMASGSCSPYEREFIRLWLELTEEKQAEYTKRFTERNLYLQAMEFDSQHKFEDRMGS